MWRGRHNVGGFHLEHSQEQVMPEEGEVGNVTEPVTDLCHVNQVHLSQHGKYVDQDFGGETLHIGSWRGKGGGEEMKNVWAIGMLV